MSKYLTLLAMVILMNQPIMASNQTLTTNSNYPSELGAKKPYDIKHLLTPVEGQGYRYTQNTYQFEGNGYYFCRQIDYLDDITDYRTSFYIPGKEGTLRHYKNGQLIEQPLKNGKLPTGSKLFIDTDAYSYILGQGYNYEELEDGTVQSVGTASIYLKKYEDRWRITYVFDKHPGTFGIMWGVGSPKQLVDFDYGSNKDIWAAYDLDDCARILLDGYYFKSPDSYIPSTSNSYWKIPSMYLASSFVKTGGSLASDLMGQSLLFTGLTNINPEGYFPSLPKSRWLFETYNIDGGFFDTRFNADMIETYMLAYNKFGHPEFREAYTRLITHYTNHIRSNHFTFTSGTDIGWLVSDYSHPDLKVKTHSSLNHQLQAIHIYLTCYEMEHDSNYYNYAKKMLNGIKLTRDLWIMESGNLEYAFLPSGRMGYTDYPYLTYNDLQRVQDDLRRIDGQPDSDLASLSESKLLWMEACGISGYQR